MPRKKHGRPWVDETVCWDYFACLLVCLFVVVHNIDQMARKYFFGKHNSNETNGKFVTCAMSMNSYYNKTRITIIINNT